MENVNYYDQNSVSVNETLEKFKKIIISDQYSSLNPIIYSPIKALEK